jgi:CRISPR-associated protein Csy2
MMSKYILINRIQVQNANAIAGFTWGFPAITHFLGFAHNLSRKLSKKEDFKDIELSGCAVISHTHQVHTYNGKYDKQFTQTRNPSYQDKEESKYKVGTPPIIEEGKMNMTVSLLIEYNGYIGNREDEFLNWIKNICCLQRLAGGTILKIKKIQLFTIDKQNINTLKRFLLPGFVLMDKSEYLEKHYYRLQEKNKEAELFDAWLDFIAIKQQARPYSDLISEYLKEDDKNKELLKLWNEHLKKPYKIAEIPPALSEYFSAENNLEKKLLEQWQNYTNPNEKTDANWENLSKPNTGYLVPIMTGYKAISKVYKNTEVENTRDYETDVCFVESVHSVGEWLSAHRLTEGKIKASIWRYDYKDNWYLCVQDKPKEINENSEIVNEDANDGMN